MKTLLAFIAAVFLGMALCACSGPELNDAEGLGMHDTSPSDHVTKAAAAEQLAKLESYGNPLTERERCLYGLLLEGGSAQDALDQCGIASTTTAGGNTVVTEPP